MNDVCPYVSRVNKNIFVLQNLGSARTVADVLYHFADLAKVDLLPQAERRAAWNGRKLTTQGAMFRPVTKVEEAATRKLRKELEAAEAAKKVERFARPKELAAEKKAVRDRARQKKP